MAFYKRLEFKSNINNECNAYDFFLVKIMINFCKQTIFLKSHGNILSVSFTCACIYIYDVKKRDDIYFDYHNTSIILILRRFGYI